MTIVPAFAISVLWEPKTNSNGENGAGWEGCNDIKDEEMGLIKLQLCASWRREIHGRTEGEKEFTVPFLWHCRWSNGTGA